MTVRLRAAGATDVGLSRSHNEDCYEVDPERELFVVADGMGGHSHGEVASRVAVEAIRRFVGQTEDRESTWPFEYDPALERHTNVLKTAIRLAHEQVLEAIRKNGALYGMGTTVVGCLVEGGRAALGHVGDSRAYLLREGRLELLTQDHTWVNEQVVAGLLSESQARDHPLKNVVTRALGGDSEVQVDVLEVDLQAGDELLLCSDGLTTMMDDREIEAALKEGDGEAPETICRWLIQQANQRGGFDNITVVHLRVDEALDEEGSPGGDDLLDETAEGETAELAAEAVESALREP